MRKVISKLFTRSKGVGCADLDYLTRLVRRYSVEKQQVPRDLLDLVTQKYLEAIPIAPAGQKFIIDRRTVEVRLE